MDIFSLLKDNFNWLKKSIKYFNFWVLVIICLWLGWHIYSLAHQSELRRIDLFDKELSLKEERLNAQLAEIEKKELPLNFKQLKMLEYINAYQNKTNLAKVVIAKEGFIFDDEKHASREKRYMIWGSTDGGRKLNIIITIRKDVIRIISARDMNGRERRAYEEKVKTNSTI